MPERVSIRPARPDEGERLREIAIAAKSHWGYEEEAIRSWAAQGDFSSVGFASLIPNGEVAMLDDLWIEPAWIGKGVGSRLFRACAARARELGARRLEWEAEPNAVGFYERMGGRYARDSQQTPFGRIVPVMSIDLELTEPG